MIKVLCVRTDSNIVFYMSLEVCKIAGLVAVLLKHVVSHNQLLIERFRILENKIFTTKYNQLLFIFISNRYCK